MFGDVIDANTFLYPDDYVDDLDNTQQYANGVTCSAKIETDTFLFPDNYVDIRWCKRYNQFGDVMEPNIFLLPDNYMDDLDNAQYANGVTCSVQ